MYPFHACNPDGNEFGAPSCATDRKKAKKRHLTEGMTEETLTDLTVLLDTYYAQGAVMI